MKIPFEKARKALKEARELCNPAPALSSSGTTTPCPKGIDTQINNRCLSKDKTCHIIDSVTAAEHALSSVIREVREHLAPLILRRTKDMRDAETGECIVQLPKKHIEVVQVTLSHEEVHL